METINFGKIKKVWKGAYDNSTAYTVDDIVSSAVFHTYAMDTTGNAPPNASYWDNYAEVQIYHQFQVLQTIYYIGMVVHGQDKH